MISSVDEFYEQAEGQILPAFNQFSATHFLKERARADHICYKCASTSSFENIRALFEEGHANFVYQSVIANRRIALIKLKRAIPTALGEISLLELSDQKPDRSQTEGFDHVEVYGINGVTYGGLVTYLKSRSLEVREIVRPHHTTHDIKMDSRYLLRLTQEPLLEKICREILSVAQS